MKPFHKPVASVAQFQWVYSNGLEWTELRSGQRFADRYIISLASQNKFYPSMILPKLG
jgi:hypothetical protein